MSLDIRYNIDNKRNFSIYIAVLMLTLNTVLAQSPIFKPVLLSDEVEEDQFNCIYQDNGGLIWIGTEKSVFTFDGSQYSTIEFPDSLSDGGVTAILQDSKQRYLFGLENGNILIYDGFENFEFLILESGKNARISNLLESAQGQIWISTYGNGVFISDMDSLIKLDMDSGLSDNYIYSMVEGNDGKIWLGTDNGINICSPFVLPISIQQISVDEGLPDFIVQSLAKDPKGNIWVGMHDHGVCYFDVAKESFELPPALKEWSYGPVKSMITLNDRLWIATSDEGIIEYKYEGAFVEVYKSCRQYNLSRVKDFIRDKEGNVWLITNTEVCLSFAGKIELMETVADQSLGNIHALTIDKNDHIWFANDNGLFSYNPMATQFDQRLSSHLLQLNLQKQKITSLYHDAYGFLWIGTFGQGVIRMDPNSGEQVLFDMDDGLVNGNILSIAGNTNEIWFGTLGGATRCKMDDRLISLASVPEFDNFGRKEGLVNNYIYQISISEEGIPYFATDGNGVYFLKEGHFYNISDTISTSKNVVYSVITDNYGNAWMNVSNEGILKYDGIELSRVTKDIAHKNQTFSGIISNKNELIMVYNAGIDVLNITIGSIRHFEENAGIFDIDPGLNALAIDSKNNVWIGSAKGIIKYHKTINETWEHPVTRLEEVALFLNKIDHRKKIQFNHNENHLSFRFTGLWYQYPERVDYVIKLEGHDIDWINTRNKQVVYSDLKPGEYIFKVKSGIYANYADSNEVSYSFTIKKAFYQSFWFFLFVFILLFGLVILIVAVRTRQIKKKQEVIQEKIRFQFENLKSQLNPHFLFNSFSTLIALIEDDSKLAVNYVEELSNLFRNVLEFKDRDLISLNKEIKIAENYISLHKKRFGKSLIIDISKTKIFDTLQIPPLTLQLLIENAIKHNIVSKEKPLKIKIYADHEKASIFVENNVQMKKEEISSMGIGLENIINRYKILTDKKVDVFTTESSFIVGLPFIQTKS